MKNLVFILFMIVPFFSCSKKTTMTESKNKPDASFTNTRWKLVNVPGMELPSMNDVYIQFSDGRASGNSGCNRFTGSYTLEEKKLKLDPLAGTRMMCSEEIMTVENAFLKIAGETDQYKISGDHLQLKKGDTVLAEFEALYL